jgi:hypothetical protein
MFARDQAMPRTSAVTCHAIASQLDAPATSKLNQRIMQRTMSRHATVVWHSAQVGGQTVPWRIKGWLVRKTGYLGGPQ